MREFYVGLDVHKSASFAVVLDAKGNIIKQGRLVNDKNSITSFFKRIDRAKVAMEACSMYEPMIEILTGMDYEVKLAIR